MIRFLRSVSRVVRDDLRGWAASWWSEHGESVGTHLRIVAALAGVAVWCAIGGNYLSHTPAGETAGYGEITLAFLPMVVMVLFAALIVMIVVGVAISSTCSYIGDVFQRARVRNATKRPA